ncbi:hypothetical protein VD0002_g1746 [Verticillium dahliae]|uniref:Uncharacterized protein n=1 Tax=Verticillium dahliae TaxID=27337 RepID=A0A2J8BXS6_VERDA|nr:hypothetical protein BJF96_g7125 [Verticillium dahliae]PNH37115.1 hypothetical protein VD0004_g9660 [Verticillium dahliae]PNH55134.1 hypothetical protein VD0003_g2452 [Verticillium dahliae]PNH67878.1 hypothetical protein VD0001_g7670 [Verticillium dahliae]PNH68245.1 hypothetical protein VD0002_g1746 [Verticillium dahliae]
MRPTMMLAFMGHGGAENDAVCRSIKTPRHEAKAHATRAEQGRCGNSASS